MTGMIGKYVKVDNFCLITMSEYGWKEPMNNMIGKIFKVTEDDPFDAHGSIKLDNTPFNWAIDDLKIVKISNCNKKVQSKSNNILFNPETLDI